MKIKFAIQYQDAQNNSQTREIPLALLAKLAGLDHCGTLGAQLIVERGDESLVASTYQSHDFPSITVDGKKGDSLLWLSENELPNSDYPGKFTSRLYAGDCDTETDCPIAAVVSSLGNKEGAGPEIARKIIHVDYDYAVARQWGEAADEHGNLKEHETD